MVNLTLLAYDVKTRQSYANLFTPQKHGLIPASSSSLFEVDGYALNT
jgi:hypothetical protein